MIEVPFGNYVLEWNVSQDAGQVATDILEYHVRDGVVKVTESSIAKALQSALQIDYGKGNRIRLRHSTVNVEGPPVGVFGG